jgi:hypothetical protein
MINSFAMNATISKTVIGSLKVVDATTKQKMAKLLANRSALSRVIDAI